MHWMLDVVFSEDECMILSENGQKTLNIFRKLALFIHKQYVATVKKKVSIRNSMLRCLMNDETFLTIL
jgi:hypothetical protein